MSPDEAIFRAHLAAAAFQDGLDRGRWGEVEGTLAWPSAILWVAADAALAPSGRLHLRFTLDGYPQQAPTALPWDAASNAPLATPLWPKGAGNVSQVFAPHWNGSALYLPCDRIAMIGHQPWSQQFPELWWQPHFTIVVYLAFVHGVLNQQKYALA